MEYSEIIYLLDETIIEDEIGNSISSSSTPTKCYAKKQSVRTSEFYNALNAGLEPTCEFVIKRLNYNNQRLLTWNGDTFSIIRTTDSKNKFDIVLVCSKKIGNNETETSE